jgi:NAD(P) transhydrogenase subunit alpha
MLEELCPGKDGQINVNMNDEVIRGATVIKDGQLTWPPPPAKLSMTPQTAKPAAAKVVHTEKATKKKSGSFVPAIAMAIALTIIGIYAPNELMGQMTVFVLSCFVGYLVVWNVKASLHTPLMSITNAISGIIAVGAVLQISSQDSVVRLVAALAILIATINIAGGFLVTRRMLKMFIK